MSKKIKSPIQNDYTPTTQEPAKKTKCKNKPTRLQQLYDEGKVTSQEFYEELTGYIRWRLYPDLIKKGYYIDGVRQSNFTREEWDACYTDVLEKIIKHYSPEKGTLATFVRWKIRGWTTIVTQKQRKVHKYCPEGVLSLDNLLYGNTTAEDVVLKEDTKTGQIETEVDMSKYRANIIDSITKDEIYKVREGIRNVNIQGEWTKLWLESK